MAKVLYLTSTLQRSGPVVVLYNILKNLDRGSVEPVVLTLSPEPSDSMWNAFQDLNVPVMSLNLSRVQGIVRGSSALQQEVWKIAPDIVQSQGIRSDILSAIGLKGYSRVSVLHNYPYADYRMTYGRLRGTIMAHLHTYCLQLLERVVACSESVAHQVSLHGVENITVIANGVDHVQFSGVSDTAKMALRQGFGIPLNSKILVFVGHLSSRKDPETLIKGFISCQLSRQMHLLLVGDGPLLDKCEQLAAGHDNIHMIGRVSNVLTYLQASDLFVSASIAEGLPNAVLEALACGLPVCLSDIPPHRELLKFDSRIGWVFGLGDANSLSNILDEIAVTDLSVRKRFILNLAETQLSAQTMANRYQALYQTM